MNNSIEIKMVIDYLNITNWVRTKTHTTETGLYFLSL